MKIKLSSKETVCGLENKQALVLLAEDDYDYKLLEQFRRVLAAHNNKEKKRLDKTLTLWEVSYEPRIDEPFQLKLASDKVAKIKPKGHWLCGSTDSKEIKRATNAMLGTSSGEFD